MNVKIKAVFSDLGPELKSAELFGLGFGVVGRLYLRGWTRAAVEIKEASFSSSFSCSAPVISW